MPPPHRHRQPAPTGTSKNIPVISILKLFLITLKSGFRRFHCQCPLSSLLKCALVLSGRRGCGPSTAPDDTETAFSSDDRNSDDNCENVARWEDSCFCQKNGFFLSCIMSNYTLARFMLCSNDFTVSSQRTLCPKLEVLTQKNVS